VLTNSDIALCCSKAFLSQDFLPLRKGERLRKVSFFFIDCWAGLAREQLPAELAEFVDVDDSTRAVEVVSVSLDS